MHVCANVRFVCKHGIAQGALRLSKIVPNPFDSYAGATDFQQHYHFLHGMKAMERVRCTTKIPSRSKHIQGLSELAAKDRKLVEQKYATLLASHKQKCKAKTKAPRRK